MAHRRCLSCLPHRLPEGLSILDRGTRTRALACAQISYPAPATPGCNSCNSCHCCNTTCLSHIHSPPHKNRRMTLHVVCFCVRVRLSFVPSSPYPFRVSNSSGNKRVASIALVLVLNLMVANAHVHILLSISPDCIFMLLVSVGACARL